MDECAKVCIVAVEACCDTSVLFELAEESLNAVALFIELFVVWDLFFAVAASGDDGAHFGLGEEGADGVGVVAFVGDEALGAQAFEEGFGLGAVVAVSARKLDFKRPAERIAEQVQLRGQSSAGSPQSLTGRPLFPVVAS